MDKKRKPDSQRLQKDFSANSYTSTSVDQYPTEQERYNDLYGPDTALGDQYVMQEQEEPQKPWNESDWEEEIEELKDKAFIKDEVSDY